MSSITKASDKNFINVADATGSLGDYITIPVTLQLSPNGELNPYVIQGKLSYDNNQLAFVNLSAENSVFEQKSWAVTGFDDGLGNIRFLSSGTESIDSSGLLFDLIFVVTSNEAGTSAIQSNPQEWNLNNFDKVVDSISTNKIEIIKSRNPSPRIGDANEDHIVNFSDVESISKHLLDISTLNEQGIINSEVNGDGHLSVSDALSILKYSSTGIWTDTDIHISSASLANISAEVKSDEIYIPLHFTNVQDLKTLELEIIYDSDCYELNNIGDIFQEKNVVNQINMKTTGKLKALIIANINYTNDIKIFTTVFRQINNRNKPDITINYSINEGTVTNKKIAVGKVTSLENKSYEMDFSLKQNYPNPFNPATKIEFNLIEGSNTQLIVYDIIGNEVAILINQTLDPGTHSISFDARSLSAGTYIYRLVAGDLRESRKMILLK